MARYDTEDDVNARSNRGQPPLPQQQKQQQKRRDIVAEINDIFTSTIGRAATQKEIDYLQNVWGYGRGAEAARSHVDSINSVINQAIALAKGSELDLGRGEILKMIDEVYTPGDLNTYNNLIPILGAQIQNKATERKLHPEKFITEDQKKGFSDTANRLISDAFGADFQDPYFAEFVSIQAAKGITPYELTQMIKQDPRFIKKEQDVERARIGTEAAGARQALSDSLLAQEDVAFDRTKSSIIGSFMGAGRLNSSGLDAALARSRENLQRDRQAFLGNIGYEDAVRQQGYGREDFIGRQGGAYQNYIRQSEPGYQTEFARMGGPLASLNRFSNLSNTLTNRSFDTQDYARSKNDYLDAIGRYNRGSRDAALYGFGGNLLGSAGQIGLMKWAGDFR